MRFVWVLLLFSMEARAVNLAWDPSPETNVTYQVYMGDLPGLGTNAPIKLPAGTNTTVRVPPMQPGEVAYFTVTASRDGLESAPSNEPPWVEPWISFGEAAPGYVRFSFLAVTPTPARPNVSYLLEFATDVEGPWHSEIHFTPVITKYAGGTELYSIDIPITSLPKFFMKARVLIQ